MVVYFPRGVLKLITVINNNNVTIYNCFGRLHIDILNFPRGRLVTLIELDTRSVLARPLNIMHMRKVPFLQLSDVLDVVKKSRVFDRAGMHCMCRREPVPHKQTRCWPSRHSSMPGDVNTLMSRCCRCRLQ